MKKTKMSLLFEIYHHKLNNTGITLLKEDKLSYFIQVYVVFNR